MPYADPDQQREARREWYRTTYNSDTKFRKAELKRKKVERSKWTAKDDEEHREYMRLYMQDYRAGVRKRAAR